MIESQTALEVLNILEEIIAKSTLGTIIFYIEGNWKLKIFESGEFYYYDFISSPRLYQGENLIPLIVDRLHHIDFSQLQTILDTSISYQITITLPNVYQWYEFEVKPRTGVEQLSQSKPEQENLMTDTLLSLLESLLNRVNFSTAGVTFYKDEYEDWEIGIYPHIKDRGLGRIYDERIIYEMGLALEKIDLSDLSSLLAQSIPYEITPYAQYRPPVYIFRVKPRTRIQQLILTAKAYDTYL